MIIIKIDGRTEPNLNDVALAFNDMNINLSDIEEYIANVDPVPCIVNVPRFPIPKESNLNFLKPGSKEVVTRPVHINEHLPPMHPHEGKCSRLMLYGLYKRNILAVLQNRQREMQTMTALMIMITKMTKVQI